MKKKILKKLLNNLPLKILSILIACNLVRCGQCE